MTLKQLEAFYWAAKLGSFSIAAQRLHVTQSSVSKRIDELEAAVRMPLFDRTGHRAIVTSAGQNLLVIASDMLALRDQAMRISHDEVSLTGECRFGISELGALTWLPGFIARLREDHPKLILKPYVDLARKLERLVSRGELDFAVAPGPAGGTELAADVVAQVSFSWMASPSRLAAGKVLTQDDFSIHPVITMTDDSGLTRAFDMWASLQGLQVQRVLACNSLTAITGLTAAGLGISFLPDGYTQTWVDQGTLVKLRSDPPLPRLNYCFLARKDDMRVVTRVLRSYLSHGVSFIPGDPSSFG